MPFSESIREEALVRAGRYCCICHKFAGRDAVVHHIEQESEGGENGIENAIVLCSRCHGEAGHYNPRHPLGTKYRPAELRRHRDDWWRYRSLHYAEAARPTGFTEDRSSGRGTPTLQKVVGTLWSNRADILQKQEIVELEARSLATERHENLERVTWLELLQRGQDEFFVYQEWNWRGDYGEATLHGAPCFGEAAKPLVLNEIQEQYASLAAAAGQQRIRRV